MRLASITLFAATLFAAPVAAGDVAGGGFGGHVSSLSFSGGVAATGGLAAGGANGTSFVRNEQFSANLSGVRGDLTFTEIDRNGAVRDVDGIEVDLNIQTLNESVQESRTKVRDRGAGTAGLGGGIAKSGGIAAGDGGMFAYGFEQW